MNKFKIAKEDEKKRLDVFLKEKYPDLSRSFLQKQIKNGEVKVNNEISTVHRFLKEGDFVFAETRESARIENELTRIEGEDGKEGEEKLRNFKLDIISETDEYLVINKPCGLIVHAGKPPLTPPQSFDGAMPSKGGESVWTLADILKRKYPAILKVGEDKQRPGIVHRLDKDVSGIMVIAKTQKMFEHLKNQFKERKINKEYIALVYGILQKPEGVINFPIARSEQNGIKMAARSVQQGGREAITEFTVLKQLSHWTVLTVKIKTGRTHQIRVHLNAYGHPVVGDNIYKPKKLKSTKKFGGKLFLHARKLGFMDLNGQWKEFEAKIPNEFSELLID
ncbi:pseudouridine synthase [Patescibacteria group bacterium]